MKATFASWSSTSTARPASLASPSLTSLSAVAAWREKRGSRWRSFAFSDPSIIPSHTSPSRNVGSMPLMRGAPSARRVASIPRPVASKRARAKPAVSGAAASISSQVAMACSLPAIRQDGDVPRLDVDECRRRFTAAPVATLATSSGGEPDDGVHLVPITFVVVNDVLLSAVDHKPKSTRKLRRLEDIAGQPRVDLLADQYADDWDALWWVRARGHAWIETDAAEALLDTLVAKYPPYRDHRPAGPFVFVAIERWQGWSATGP